MELKFDMYVTILALTMRIQQLDYIQSNYFFHQPLQPIL